MRYQVPQFVDIEDKIIGPFTLKQFLMYLSAVLALIPVYLLSDLSLFLAIAIPVMGVAAAFAHLKINGKSLAGIIGSGFLFLTRGQIYIWQRTSNAKPLVLRDAQWEELLLAREASRSGMSSLSELAQTLETEGHVVKSDDVPDEFDVEGATAARTS